jgi:glutaredoxin
MPKLTLFILESCPYCIRALKYLAELQNEDPKYKTIEIDLIDERKNRALANSYDYYLVPTFYKDKTKLFEGIMKKEDVKRVLDSVLISQ